jgi:hypothetical protein
MILSQNNIYSMINLMSDYLLGILTVRKRAVFEKIRVAQLFNVLPVFYEPKSSVRHKFGFS